MIVLKYARLLEYIKEDSFVSDSSVTKKTFAAALKELCRHQSFDKISIADITRACGYTRQTFYYHFQDKFDLLNWIYYNEGIAPFITGINFDNWNDRVLGILKTMAEDKPFYLNTIRRQEQHFHGYFYQIIHALFCDAIEKLDTDHRLSLEARDFYARFYSFGICGTVIDWAKGGMRIPPETVANYLKNLAPRQYRHLRIE